MNRKSAIPPCLPLLALAALACNSCGSFAANARKSAEHPPQASSPLDGGFGLAMTTLRATALATVRQPVTTLRTGGALAWNRSREFVRANISLADLPQQPPPYTPGSEAFERALERKGIRKLAHGTVRARVDGPEFFPALQREVAAARETIDTQVFIFDNDDTGVACADALRARSRDVRVRVLFDDLGTTLAHTAAPDTPGPNGFSPPANIARYLENGSRVRARRILNPWLVSDHTKLIVIDHRTAFLGGMNLGREYRSEWHDLMVQVEGPVVGLLQREFNRSWRKAGPWGDLALLRSPARRRLPPGGGPLLRLMRTDPAEGRYDILNATRLAIRASRKRIWIENPYVASDEIADDLVAAARRGVDVRVILPSRSDSGIMDAGNHATARQLMAAGIQVLRYPRMTHLKAMICDDWTTFGSANLDTLSLRINREFNLASNAPEVVRELERRIFLPDFRRCRPFRPAETDGPLNPLAESIADHL